ncbi:hypothetical protein [Sphaerisporangium corydalis]|uniref:Uncharacterized protein n=1 Tax=Sphaerisporangium corydalis TaxID=1441875 RepID=A0ABV9EH11_9ACTN|nr:hypothetical protein [Sphaerisporangium corydalis]
MRKRTRLVVATATLAALAATGTTAAAASGPTPQPGPVKPDSVTVKVDGKPKESADAGLAEAAAKLGVTLDRLTAAIVAAKTSLAGSDDVRPDAVVAAIAAELGLPAPQVQKAMGPLIGRPGPAGDEKVKRDIERKRNEVLRGGEGADGPQCSPAGKDGGSTEGPPSAPPGEDGTDGPRSAPTGEDAPVGPPAGKG